MMPTGTVGSRATNGAAEMSEFRGIEEHSATATHRQAVQLKDPLPADPILAALSKGYEWPHNADLFHQIDKDSNSVPSPDELRNFIGNHSATRPKR